jgi:hypothetical protein
MLYWDYVTATYFCLGLFGLSGMMETKRPDFNNGESISVIELFKNFSF